MSERQAQSRLVIPVIGLIALAGVCGPLLELESIEFALRLAADSAAASVPTGPPQGESPDQPDQPVIIVTNGCEWDRVVKVSPLADSVRAMGLLVVSGTHRAWFTGLGQPCDPPTPAALLAISGPHRNHAPHAPPWPIDV